MQAWMECHGPDSAQQGRVNALIDTPSLIIISAPTFNCGVNTGPALDLPASLC